MGHQPLLATIAAGLVVMVDLKMESWHRVIALSPQQHGDGSL
jgi:hypothetical protein